MLIEKKKIKDLKPAPYNPRKSTEKQEARLKESLVKFGVVEPIIFNKQTGYIVGGHFRVRELKKLGYTEIDCVIVDLNEADEKELNIRLNANTGEWDMEMLGEWNSEELEAWGLDIGNFGSESVEELEAKDDDFDATPPAVPITVLGDLYEIGEHRLLCGDSTDSDQVAKLMNGQKADMVFTDPPYDLENEDYHKNILLFTQNAHVFVMHDDKGIVNYLRLSSLDFSRFYVANFGFSSPRGNDPYLSHILISQEKNGNAIPHKNMHDGFRSIIPMEYRFRLKDDKTEHKHQKPIKFIETFINHFSNEKSLVLDLFLGSGSTMVASHQLKRKCYGMELDPKYCDVIVKRMIKLYDKLTVKRNGIDCTNEFKEV
jgi:DNA modification methylase